VDGLPFVLLVRRLGRGILPDASPDQVKFVVDRVHAWRG
jgi:uroporphyrinogen-III decarboxylase